MSYLKKFTALAKELARHEHIEIVEFKAQPPLKPAKLKAVEAKLGAKLADEIREFYGEANGLKLQWQINPLVSPETAVELRKKSSDYYVKIAEYVGDPFANINLIPLDESINQRRKEIGHGGIEEAVNFRGREYDLNGFAARLKPFDLMNEKMCMAFLTEEGNGDPPVLLLTEGCTDWTDSRLTNFASYIEMLLATRGIVEARQKIFAKTAGYKDKPLVGGAEFWQRYVPKLFRNSK
jgi:hypothetical protein